MQIVLFQTIQFSMNTQFTCKTFQTIQFSQTVLIQTNQFSLSMEFWMYTITCQNSSISKNSF